MKNIIRTESVCKDFKVGNQTVNVLKNISMDIEEGSLTILRGRSGSGKTTLINLLGMIDLPTKGSVLIENREVRSIDEKEKNTIRQNLFGYIFQAGALLPNLTIGENVELPLRLARLPLKKRKQRVEECLTMVGLLKKIKQFPEELSGGEMQRIGIARAIVHKPKIIFADEPTSALDFTTGLKIVRLFKELILVEGTTLVMTTHDPKLLPIANYVYNLKDGEIVDE